MEDDHRVWPPHPGPRHRRTPPYGTGREPGPRRGQPYGPTRPAAPPDPGGNVRDEEPGDGGGAQPGRTGSGQQPGGGDAAAASAGAGAPGHPGTAWPASGGDDELDARWPSSWQGDPEGAWDDDEAEEEPWSPRPRRGADRTFDRAFDRTIGRAYDRLFGRDAGDGLDLHDRASDRGQDSGHERGHDGDRWSRDAGHDLRGGFGRGLDRGSGRGLDQDGGPRVPWQSLPPSARLYGAPADPGLSRKARGRGPRRVAGALLAVVLAVAAVASLVVAVQRLTAAPAQAGRLHDPRARVTIPLPAGWRAERVPPVTGFTTAATDGAGGLVMARPFGGATRESMVEAAELYSRLLLKGDRVTVVADRQVPGGHSRALRAEYQDVVNRPAYLRVILLTRDGGAVLVVGLLQPDEPARRQALDTLLSSVR
ncbi:hypothetical protein ACGF0J_31450 [Nonomuraea sp. NPDC047897]|uniref:hypothetical protein n=1 Tax=Nonomuraea sp. NPDC047897 TaxID=3364346 RepID=UPI00371FAC9F